MKYGCVFVSRLIYLWRLNWWCWIESHWDQQEAEGQTLSEGPECISPLEFVSSPLLYVCPLPSLLFSKQCPSQQQSHTCAVMVYEGFPTWMEGCGKEMEGVRQREEEREEGRKFAVWLIALLLRFLVWIVAWSLHLCKLDVLMLMIWWTVNKVACHWCV